MNKTTIQGLSISYFGDVFCYVHAKNTDNPSELAKSYFGDIWFGYSDDVTPIITGNIKAILKVTTPYINRFIGVDMTHVEG